MVSGFCRGAQDASHPLPTELCPRSGVSHGTTSPWPGLAIMQVSQALPTHEDRGMRRCRV